MLHINTIMKELDYLSILLYSFADSLKTIYYILYCYSFTNLITDLTHSVQEVINIREREIIKVYQREIKISYIISIVK